MSATDDSNEIRITRLYDAPVAMVWEAWVDDTQVGHWWGPRGFSITTKTKDVRPGGHWEYTMHGPDGKDWPNYTRYHVVEPQARLEYDHGATSADSAPMFRVTATFTDVGGKTQLEMAMAFPSVEHARQSRQFIKAAGGYGTWDRLAEYLEQRVSQREVFVIARTFDAPIERVFDAWTDPAQLAQWLPPTGMRMAVQHGEIRAGGRCAFSMFNEHFTMYGRCEYEEITRPTRIVYRQSFTSEDGTVTRHPGAPDWPLVMRCEIDLTAETPETTRVRIRTSLPDAVTPAELAAFTTERGGMTGGWSGSFDKLETLLADAPVTA